MRSSVQPGPVVIAPGTPVAVRLGWQATAEAVLADWPGDRPLAALWSGGVRSEPASRARWRVLASPTGVHRATLAGAAAEQGLLPPLSAHPRPRAGSAPGSGPAAPPFLGGWIGLIRYEAGRVLEPAAAWGAGRGTADADAPPLAEWLHCPAAYVQDTASGAWWFVGDPAQAGALPWGTGAAAEPTPGIEGERRGPAFTVAGLTSTTGRGAFERAVARAVEYIHAGDCFQVNLAHHLVGRFDGSSRAAFAAALGVEPWYGAYLELPPAPPHPLARDGLRRAVLSLSPELFLEVDGATGRVVTRPIKGTRRAGPRSALELDASAKDHAELAMIIDLMRNDLGRVCRIGSVRVDEARAIERHAGTLDHGVATVSGTLRDDAGLEALIAAAFPPGSVTGAPKVRAMQIIEELEGGSPPHPPHPRGVYCGCVGFISACGNATFNVAIRTATIEQRRADGTISTNGHAFTDATIDLPVGAGIVAESDPAREWQETLDKAEAIKKALLNEP